MDGIQFFLIIYFEVIHLSGLSKTSQTRELNFSGIGPVIEKALYIQGIVANQRPLTSSIIRNRFSNLPNTLEKLLKLEHEQKLQKLTKNMLILFYFLNFEKYG